MSNKNQICKVCEEEMKLTEITTHGYKTIYVYLCACNDMIKKAKAKELQTEVKP